MNKNLANSKLSESNFKSRTVCINRVVKVIEGGRRFKFSALVVVGDGNGIIGFGVGKSGEVNSAVSKGEMAAKRNLIKFPILHGTIPHECYGKHDGNYVFLKPAIEGTGVKAGGVARMVCEIGGIENVISKCFKRNSPYNVIQATFNALKKLRDPIKIAKDRGVSLEKVFKG